MCIHTSTHKQVPYAYQWGTFISSVGLMWCQGSGGAVSSTQRASGASVAKSTAVSTILSTDYPLVLSSTALWLAILETPIFFCSLNTVKVPYGGFIVHKHSFVYIQHLSRSRKAMPDLQMWSCESDRILIIKRYIHLHLALSFPY